MPQPKVRLHRRHSEISERKHMPGNYICARWAFSKAPKAKDFVM